MAHATFSVDITMHMYLCLYVSTHTSRGAHPYTHVPVSKYMSTDVNPLNRSAQHHQSVDITIHMCLCLYICLHKHVDKEALHTIRPHISRLLCTFPFDVTIYIHMSRDHIHTYVT